MPEGLSRYDAVNLRSILNRIAFEMDISFTEKATIDKMVKQLQAIVLPENLAKGLLIAEDEREENNRDKTNGSVASVAKSNNLQEIFDEQRFSETLPFQVSVAERHCTALGMDLANNTGLVSHAAYNTTLPMIKTGSDVSQSVLSKKGFQEAGYVDYLEHGRSVLHEYPD